MRLASFLAGGLATFFLTAAGSARAEAPPDPLRLIPARADLIVRIEKPRQLVEALTTLPAVQKGTQLDAVRELLDNTSVRRFYQLIAYYEKALDARWPELLDKLAGGGMAIAFQYSGGEPKALLVVQSTDKAALRQFTDLVLKVVEDELARQESKDKIVQATYRDIVGYRIGDKLFAAVADGALLIANDEGAIKAGLDRALDHKGDSLADVPSLAAARKLLPADPLAWAWLNFEAVRAAPGAKDVFALPRNNAAATVLFGGWLDVAGRTPYLAAGLYREPKGLALRFRMPKGRDGLAEPLALHVPKASKPGTLPNLEPKGVVFSHSFYLDLQKLWTERTKLLTAEQVKGLEEADKNAGRLLQSVAVSKLLEQSGPYHRVVVVQLDKPDYPDYKIKPDAPIPAFAFVNSMRDPAFGQTMETVLRGAALFAGGQVGLKMKEETIDGVKLVGYRFPEDGKFAIDVNKLRFNFAPCFATVGNQFFVCSSMELGRRLIPLLQAEAKAKPAGNSATMRMRFYGTGGADLLVASQDQLIAQTILDRAARPEEARRQVKDLVSWLRHLGRLEIEADYRAAEFRFDIRFGQD